MPTVSTENAIITTSEKEMPAQESIKR